MTAFGACKEWTVFYIRHCRHGQHEIRCHSGPDYNKRCRIIVYVLGCNFTNGNLLVFTIASLMFLVWGVLQNLVIFYART